MLSESMRGVVAQTLLKKIGGGRIAALEILLHTNAVANLIREGKTFQLTSIMQTAKAQGMVLLNDALLSLVKKGLVEPAEALFKAVDKSGLLSLFRGNDIPLPGEAKSEAGAHGPATAGTPGGLGAKGAAAGTAPGAGAPQLAGSGRR